METLSNDAPTLLSNIEVMEVLSERIEARKKAEEKQSASGKKRRKQHPQLQHRDWIEEKALKYIQSTPCANVDIERMPQLVSSLRGTKRTGELKKTDNVNEKQTEDGFDLTDAETLQVLNFMPQESVDIHLMVEELHSRMSDERQEELLQLIDSYTRQEGPTDQVMEDVFKNETSGIAENGYVDEDRKPAARPLNAKETALSETSNGVAMKEEPP